MDLKIKLETTTKNHQASIQNLEAKFDRLADKHSGRPYGSLPSNTQPNPKSSSSKPYQPSQAQNEHVNAVFTHSGKSYDPPINPNDHQNYFEIPINFDSEDEDEESTPQLKSQTLKPVKETPIPKPYKPKIPYLQRLRKAKKWKPNMVALDHYRDAFSVIHLIFAHSSFLFTPLMKFLYPYNSALPRVGVQFSNVSKGKDFYGRDTPLFQTMMGQAQEEGEGSVMPTVPQHTLNQPSSSQPQKKQKPRKVLDLENTKTSQAAEITKLKKRVKKLERMNKSRTQGLKRLRKVGRTARIESSEDKGLGDQEDASKQGRKINDIDADKEVTLIDETQGRNDDNLMGAVVQEPSEFTTTISPSQPSQLLQAKDKGNAKMVELEIPLKKKDQILIDEEIAQKLQEELQAELEKRDDYELTARLQAQEVNTFVDIDIKLVKGSETRTEGSSKRENEKALEDSPDDEVAIDATPLSTKPPIIVDWKNIKEGNMNINKEDLETLWNLVKAKHGLTRPKEAYERVLWGDLKVMFERDVESKVWRNLQGHKVTVWKLFSLSGVHFVRF
ncbi:hypothetical protein Tco_0830015 [Tanacetum coccineum]